LSVRFELTKDKLIAVDDDDAKLSPSGLQRKNQHHCTEETRGEAQQGQFRLNSIGAHQFKDGSNQWCNHSIIRIKLKHHNNLHYNQCCNKQTEHLKYIPQ